MPGQLEQREFWVRGRVNVLSSFGSTDWQSAVESMNDHADRRQTFLKRGVCPRVPRRTPKVLNSPIDAGIDTTRPTHSLSNTSLEHGLLAITIETLDRLAKGLALPLFAAFSLKENDEMAQIGDLIRRLPPTHLEKLRREVTRMLQSR